MADGRDTSDPTRGGDVFGHEHRAHRGHPDEHRAEHHGDRGDEQFGRGHPVADDGAHVGRGHHIGHAGDHFGRGHQFDDGPHAEQSAGLAAHGDHAMPTGSSQHLEPTLHSGPDVAGFGQPATHVADGGNPADGTPDPGTVTGHPTDSGPSDPASAHAVVADPTVHDPAVTDPPADAGSAPPVLHDTVLTAWLNDGVSAWQPDPNHPGIDYIGYGTFDSPMQ